MFWIGLIIGLFVGANAGILIAGMLVSAKMRDKARSEMTDKDEVDDNTGSHRNVERESYSPIYNSEDVQKTFPDSTMS